MPKTASSAVIWSSERKSYEFYGQHGKKHCRSPYNCENWHSWLDTRTSFSFQGHSGRLSLLKEPRPRGEGYWYAYRRYGGKIVKKYMGRTSDLSIERLEAAAEALNSEDGEPLPASPRSSEDQAKAEGESSPEIQHPLLTPKLRLPRQHSFLVPREHLFAQLNAARERKLTLVSAPAGFGKTTLVSAWAARLPQQGGPGVAWLSLDEGDNDPVRFWRYVIAACQMLHPSIRQSSLALLDEWRTFSFDREQAFLVITALLNALHDLPGRGVLVLEDYHDISTPLIHQSLATFVDHLPPTLHLVILTRSDPPLPLARLRADNDLYELHAADLRFSVEETQAFLDQALSLLLPIEVAQRLTTRTEGWVVGVQLATLALQGRIDPQDMEHVLATFTGSHRHVVEYLVAEVLTAQPEPLQEFLLQTSLLNCLTASLCGAVTGRTESDLLLDQLERAQLFLVPLDGSGQWYRYHALFAEAMRSEARRRFGEERLRDLVLKACRWYEAHDMLTEAIESALSARAFEYAARLIQRSAERAFHFNGIEEFHTLRRWLDALPQEVLQAHPHLCFGQAMALLFTLDRHSPITRARVEAPLQLAERHWQSQGNHHKLGEILAFRSLVVGWQGDLSLSFALARQALALLPQEEMQWRGISLVNVGKEAQLMGRLNEARQLLTEGSICCEAVRNIYLLLAATITLGNVCFAQGALHQASRYYQWVSEIALGKWRGLYEQGKKALDDRGLTQIGLARLSYEWNELEMAERQASEGLAIGEQLNNEFLFVSASLVLARIWQAQGESARAQQFLQECSSRINMPWHLRDVLLEQVWLALVNGDLDTAQRRIASCTQHGEQVFRQQQEQQALLVAHLLIAQGQIQEALASLQHWQAEAHEMGRGRSEIQILAIIALAYLAQGDLSQAKQFLLQALEMARPEGHRRVFLDEGEKMVTLLRIILPDRREEPMYSYLRDLVFAAAGSSSTTSAANQLSPQEQRVLRLLASGRSRPEIARELVVSVNTIKTQVHSIYRKLQVTSRKEACDMARRLHLL
jgi:LuxR family maltose regulon positive regulatory protein